MVNQPHELPVTGTACRPSFLPLFVLGRNNLNPRLTVGERGLEIRVVRTTPLNWDKISQVDVRKGIGSTYAVITHQGWDYIAHFRDLTGLQSLIAETQSRGIMLTDSAQAFANHQT